MGNSEIGETQTKNQMKIETNRSEQIKNIDPEIQRLELILNSIIQKQGGIQIMASAILKNESEELFKKEDSMCIIYFENASNGIIMNNGLGNGFFCKLNHSYIPFKKALFTNNHILNEKSIQTGKKIKLKYQQKVITLDITEKRNAFTDEKLDYTCVEIFDEDGINNFFEIDINDFKNKKLLKNQEIFILQYNNNRLLAFSSGKILYIGDNKIIHSCVTVDGSSGSPLIRRNRNQLNFVVGIHVGTIRDHKFPNIAIPFDNILEDLKLKIIKSSKIKIIAHINIPEDNYKVRIINSSEEHERDDKLKIDYSNILKNEKEIKNCMIFINNNKIDFTYYYTFNKGFYEIIYIFHNLLNSTNFMFYDCRDLYDLDLTSFNTQNVTNMSFMFYRCYSLRKLNLSNLNTEKVTDMSWMFNECKSLKYLDLSNFKTKNVKDMSKMFNRCKSLVNLNISTFNTENVTNMLSMFWGCESLIKLDVSNFNTEKVENMQQMFCRCYSLKELDVSNFKTEKVTSMLEMFHDCHSLENLNLKSFSLKNCKTALGMLSDCKSLIKIRYIKF